MTRGEKTELELTPLGNGNLSLKVQLMELFRVVYKGDGVVEMQGVEHTFRMAKVDDSRVLTYYLGEPYVFVPPLFPPFVYKLLKMPVPPKSIRPKSSPQKGDAPSFRECQSVLDADTP